MGQVIHEGEEAYIGCDAVGLEDVTYGWRVNRDGGETFEEDMIGMTALAGAGIFGSLALILSLMRPK